MTQSEKEALFAEWEQRQKEIKLAEQQARRVWNSIKQDIPPAPGVTNRLVKQYDYENAISVLVRSAFGFKRTQNLKPEHEPEVRKFVDSLCAVVCAKGLTP